MQCSLHTQHQQQKSHTEAFIREYMVSGWGQAMWHAGDRLPEWRNRLSKEGVQHLVAAVAAAGYRQIERRTGYSLPLKDRAAMKKSKLSFIEHE